MSDLCRYLKAYTRSRIDSLQDHLWIYFKVWEKFRLKLRSGPAKGRNLAPKKMKL